MERTDQYKGWLIYNNLAEQVQSLAEGESQTYGHWYMFQDEVIGFPRYLESQIPDATFEFIKSEDSNKGYWHQDDDQILFNLKMTKGKPNYSWKSFTLEIKEKWIKSKN